MTESDKIFIFNKGSDKIYIKVTIRLWWENEKQFIKQ